ncbi:homoserine kinase [Clostridium paraputrificum]|uniref:homoserine kinase n=1 Tax=Clostridium TaxID=1485 RepID=UPI003D34454F
MIRVRVPATSANMGPGFDSLGIAIQLYNEFGFRETESGLSFKGVPEEFCNEDNVIYEAMMKCFKKANYEPKGLEISTLKQDIPIARGLGSSSSCIVGGLVGANEIMGNPFSKDEIFQMAVEMEGHPDNVAPAVLGGMVVAIMEEDKVYYDMVKVQEHIRFVPIIPDFRLATKDARDVLPEKISMKDGVYNVARAALMVTAMSNGNHELLKFACKDAFHENYRSKLIKGFDEVKNEAYRVGALASYLSGAGPTIMALISDKEVGFSNKMQEFLEANSLNWDIYELSIDTVGAKVIEGEE